MDAGRDKIATAHFWPAPSLASSGLVAVNQKAAPLTSSLMLYDYLMRVSNNVPFRSCPKRSPIKAPGLQRRATH